MSTSPEPDGHYKYGDVCTERMSEVCLPTFWNHHVRIFQECFSDWGFYIFILFVALILPGVKCFCYNMKLQYSRQALELSIKERTSFIWTDVAYYAGFSFCQILTIVLLTSSNLGIIIAVFVSKVVSESLFIAFEKQDQVSFSKEQEQDMLNRFIKKTCKDQKLTF